MSSGSMKTRGQANEEVAASLLSTEMLAAAVWRRLQRVDELNEACRYLAKFGPRSGDKPPGRNKAKTESSTPREYPKSDA